MISQKLPISSLKPLLDSFQGCFKDNFRFFAGLYFLYRWTLLHIYKNTKSYSAYYTPVGVTSVFMLTLYILFVSPTSNRSTVSWTHYFFANLALINSFPFSTFTVVIIGKEQQFHQLTLIYLPLVVMGMCLLVTICKNVMKHRCVGKLAGASIIFIPKKASHLRELISVQNED